LASTTLANSTGIANRLEDAAVALGDGAIDHSRRWK
jgi:hypothetical protein